MKPILLYEGQGKTLRQAAAATGSVLADPVITAIEVGEYTEGFAGFDCLEYNLFFKADAAATGDLVIEISGSNEFANAETWHTVVMTADIYGNWKSGGLLGGFFRVQNDTDQPVTIILQKRLA